MLSTGENVEKTGGTGITTHPSSASLPNAHVIFRWNKVDGGMKQAKGRKEGQKATCKPHLWFELFKKKCRLSLFAPACLLVARALAHNCTPTVTC